MTTKAFLLGECDNIGALLDRTLRFDYGLEGSFEFYEECSARLGILQSELNAVDPANLPQVGILSRGLAELTQLICRIERSSIGEYSWPFVEELKRIAASICTEATIDDPDAPLKVYVLAEGALDAYCIYHERLRPSYAKRRLLTIVFPKTLKHFVLLHSILGHEIGHAIFGCTKHQATLVKDVLSHLTHVGGAFETAAATAAHIFSNTVPPSVLADLSSRGATEANLFVEFSDWSSWWEELLCDVIGLVSFGPAFVAAECSLLYSLDVTGLGVGPYHPLVAWRINLLRRGAKLLGLDLLPENDSPLKEAMQEFWNYIDTFVKNDPWCDVLDDAEFLAALNGAEKLLSLHKPAAYPPPSFEAMEKMLSAIHRLVPPVGFAVDSQGEPHCDNVDFRHILYVGWIESRRQNGSGTTFSIVNKLCEHAIMQQRAISIALEGGM